MEEYSSYSISLLNSEIRIQEYEPILRSILGNIPKDGMYFVSNGRVLVIENDQKTYTMNGLCDKAKHIATALDHDIELNGRIIFSDETSELMLIRVKVVGGEIEYNAGR